MPDQDALLGQNLVEIKVGPGDRGEPRNPAFTGSYTLAEVVALALCTQDAQCGAEADGHLDGCPVEERLSEEFGY